MRTLEKGLTHHHTKCRTIHMHKSDGTIATTNNKSAESPLPCDETALGLIEQSSEFTHLEEAPSLTNVRVALHRMANSKAPGPSSVTSVRIHGTRVVTRTH
eukprot:9738997-Ditylum_brightwellii.AAC.1